MRVRVTYCLGKGYTGFTAALPNEKWTPSVTSVVGGFCFHARVS
jgi:hypothetical protein